MDERIRDLLREMFKRDAESASEHCVSIEHLHATWRTLLADPSYGFLESEVQQLWEELDLSGLG